MNKLGSYSKLVLAGAMAVLLAACAGPGTKSGVKKDTSLVHYKRDSVNRLAYNDADFPANANSGVTQLVGTAYLSDANTGGRRIGVMVDVVLNPVSALSNQWYKSVCKRGKFLVGKPDPRYAAKAYKTVTNQFGQFSFANVPLGDYYLTSRLYWVDEKPLSGPIEYGGLLAKKVRLQGATNNIDLSDADQCGDYFHS